MFAGLTKIASSDPEVDAAYQGHSIQGIAFYFTREPNLIADISSTWEERSAHYAVTKRSSPPQTWSNWCALDMKSQQVAQGHRSLGRAVEGIAYECVACRHLVDVMERRSVHILFTRALVVTLKG